MSDNNKKPKTDPMLDINKLAYSLNLSEAVRLANAALTNAGLKAVYKIHILSEE